MDTLIVNIGGKIRRAIMNGREYVVAPLVMIVPGVLNGSKGPLYYPPDEIRKTADAWNDVPIVVYHPMRNGMPISARAPGVYDQQGIGTVRNARVDTRGRLLAEGWFEVDATRRVDPRVFNTLELAQPMELSTGVFTDNENAQMGASHNGRSYTHIARNYRPDHLAILPDQVGACSKRDGCGVLVNTANTTEQWTTVSKIHVVVENKKDCHCKGKCGKCSLSKDAHVIEDDEVIESIEPATNADTNCGIGPNGFAQGNDCAGQQQQPVHQPVGGRGRGKKKKNDWDKKRKDAALRDSGEAASRIAEYRNKLKANNWAPVDNGGPGSGNFGRRGRPGKVGGSAPSSGSAGSPRSASERPTDPELEKFVTELYSTGWKPVENVRVQSSKPSAYPKDIESCDWKTIQGTPVCIDSGGSIAKGPKALKDGKPGKFTNTRGSKTQKDILKDAVASGDTQTVEMLSRGRDRTPPGKKKKMDVSALYAIAYGGPGEEDDQLQMIDKLNNDPAAQLWEPVRAVRSRSTTRALRTPKPRNGGSRRSRVANAMLDESCGTAIVGSQATFATF